MDGEVILTLRSINFSGNNEVILYLFYSKAFEDILGLVPSLDRIKLLFGNVLILSSQDSYVRTAE